MARTRYLKPEFFSNEQLADLDPLTRLLFAGLWCWSDREGRLEDRPRRIQAEILPYESSAKAEEMLAALATAGFILRYEVDGAKYIQIANFTKHQRPHPHEPLSGFPPPQEKSARYNVARASDNVTPSRDKSDSNSNSNSYSNEKNIPALSLSNCARAPAREPANAGEREGGSSYSLADCRKYSESLPDIRSPAAFAKMIWRSGEDDAAIAEFIARGGRVDTIKQRNARIFRRISERRAHRDN